MRTQLATFAVTALLVAPFTAFAESMIPADTTTQSSATMQGSQAAADSQQGGLEKMTAEIVQIKGDRVIAEADNGRVLVFLIQDFNGRQFNVGDALELKIDEQANTAEVVNVLPRHASPTS